MTSDYLECVRACEERIVNCWPAVETLLIGDFVVRLANGYSGRANSASPIRPQALLPDQDIETIERIYRAAGLKPCFRATALMHPEMRARLMDRGYRIKDTSFGMIAPLDAPEGEINPAIRFADTPDAAWFAGVSALQSGDKRNPAHLAAILGRLRVSAFFATVAMEGRDLGFGYTALDRGMAEIASIILAPEARGRGLGRGLVKGLLAKAREAGAHTAFLQVEQTNAVAIKLYDSLGFRQLYRYETLVLPA